MKKLTKEVVDFTNAFCFWGAFTFATILKAFIDKYGDEAKTIAEKALREAGRKVGKGWAKEQGRNDLDAFDRAFIQQFGAAVDYVEKTDEKFLFRFPWCAYHEAWKALGLSRKDMTEVCDFFCVPADEGLREGFNPNMKFKHTKLMPKGDVYCEFSHTLKNK